MAYNITNIQPLAGIGSGLGALSGGISSGGSANSSQSISRANTAGRAATASSNMQAAAANNNAMSAWQAAAQYNAEQAAIQRAWEEKMANTVYQRTVKDMKKAGINPILAAKMGIGSASVGSGATASMSNPSTYMGQSFAEQNSASMSQSQGSSWNNSEWGLATGLKMLGDMAQDMINAVQTGTTLNFMFPEHTSYDVTGFDGKSYNTDELFGQDPTGRLTSGRLIEDLLTKGYSKIKGWWNGQKAILKEQAQKGTAKQGNSTYGYRAGTRKKG